MKEVQSAKDGRASYWALRNHYLGCAHLDHIEKEVRGFLKKIGYRDPKAI